MVRPVLPALTFTLSPSAILPFQQQLRQRILQAALDHALERPRAIDRIVARVRQPFARLGVERRSRSCGRRAASAGARSGYRRSCPCSSRLRRWNRMISSSRLRNSGRKCARTASITCARACCGLRALADREEFGAEVRGQDDDRVRKSTVRPCPSVRRPSSSTCSSTLNTSACAFSTSSNRIT